MPKLDAPYNSTTHFQEEYLMKLKFPSFAIGLIPLLSIFSNLPSCAPVASAVPVVQQVWAFCGVNPADPLVAEKTAALAAAGVTATLGPCMPPNFPNEVRPDSDGPPYYSVEEPGRRYMTWQEYSSMMWWNAQYGMKSVIRDDRLWSEDPNVRQQAIDFWLPWSPNLAGIDLIDEPDPRTATPNGLVVTDERTPSWQTISRRWNLIIDKVMPVLGVGPFINHLGDASVLDTALADMKLSNVHLSFDNYDMASSLGLARQFDGRANHLMCAVNALSGWWMPTDSRTIRQQIQDHRRAGCDGILLFGGGYPYCWFPRPGAPALWFWTEKMCHDSDPAWAHQTAAGLTFGSSLYDAGGNWNVSWINAVREGAYGRLRK